MNKETTRVTLVGLGGSFWCAGWLFTLGFANLAFGQGALALLIWPYYLGVAIRPIAV